MITVATPTVEEIVVRMKEEILAEVADGQHMEALTFGHIMLERRGDFAYGGLDHALLGAIGHDRFYALARKAYDQVDAWIRNDGLNDAKLLVLSLAVVRESQR